MSRNFEYLGETFQIQLINQLIVEKEFSHTILDVLEPTHFENKYFKTLVQLIKEYYIKYECSPSFETLFQIVKSEFPQELMLKILNDTITKIQKAPSDGTAFVQEKALKFCKQQELQKAITKSQKILDSGEFENYDKLEELIKAALQVGENNKNVVDVFNDLDDLLREDFRHPIPMGIPGLDNLLKGGLAKGELGVILAATGVGKSSILTKIANTAFNLGYNVLQIFFEDNPKVIQRKHFTIWTGIAPDNLPNHKEEVLAKADEIKNNFKNNLYIKKMASDTYTMTQIKGMVRKMIADGNPVDMIVLDYIDCVVPDKNLGDEWKSEGSVMRGYEAMCHEIGVVGWTATQGNRSSISSEIVTTDQMGGSIKKAQVGHVIITVAKTLQQKEAGLATIAVTKSRIGKDGVVFENCKFDNEMLIIDTENSVTFLGFEENKEEKKRDRIKELMEQRQQRLSEKTKN